MACDKKKFVNTFGLIRRRRRRRRRRVSSKKKHQREIDQMSNVKDKKEKKGEKTHNKTEEQKI